LERLLISFSRTPPLAPRVLRHNAGGARVCRITSGLRQTFEAK
jgi:hypothetical protein